MKGNSSRALRKRQRRIQRRLDGRRNRSGKRPAIGRQRPKYEMGNRAQATKAGGIGAIHALAASLGLPKAIDERLHLLKRHQPYHESDHVLSLAYSVLGGGMRLQDLDLLREDEALLDLLGARRLPDPTTAGDFLRRFEQADIWRLQRLVNQARAEVWRQQPESFRKRAVLEADGIVVGTAGEKKEGMEYNAHKQLWGYHPLLISLANSREPLYLVNRPGNVPSHKGAAPVIDEAIALVQPIFEEVWLRGDTDFSLTVNFDGWTERGVRFVLGYDAIPKLKEIAERVPADAWRRLDRRPRYEVATDPRAKRANTKEGLVDQKGWKNLVLESEDVTEVEYRPLKCSRAYRMVILRKNLAEKRGGLRLFDECRYFFYITNVPTLTTEEVVAESNQRCDQENLIAQLRAVSALSSPAHDLLSNWAYMVIAALAWSLKAWFGLTLPRSQDRDTVLRMEFKQFLNWVVLVPAQIVRTGRQLVVRLLAYTRHVRLLFRSVERSAALAFP